MRKLMINKILVVWSWLTVGVWLVFTALFFTNMGMHVRESDLNNPLSLVSILLDTFGMVMLITLIGLIIAIIATVKSSKAKIPLTGHVLAIFGFLAGLTLIGLFVGQIGLLIIAAIIISKKQKLIEIER